MIAFSFLLFFVLAGAFISTLLENHTSPVLFDKLIVAGCGAVFGIIFFILLFFAYSFWRIYGN